jgi:hypothetical protein
MTTNGPAMPDPTLDANYPPPPAEVPAAAEAPAPAAATTQAHPLREAMTLLLKGATIQQQAAVFITRFIESGAPAPASDAPPTLLKPNPELAKKYVEEAAMFRRRAKSREPIQPAEAEMQAPWAAAHAEWAAAAQESSDRAAWLDARAPFKAAGTPMPHELRTKLEAVELVDVFRKQLRAPLDLLFAYLVPDDLHAAIGALRFPELVTRREAAFAASTTRGVVPGMTGKSIPVSDELAEIDQAVNQFVAAATRLVSLLGLRDGRFAPFVVEATQR